MPEIRVLRLGMDKLRWVRISFLLRLEITEQPQEKGPWERGWYRYSVILM